MVIKYLRLKCTDVFSRTHNIHIYRYAGDIVISRIVVSGFHCNRNQYVSINGHNSTVMKIATDDLPSCLDSSSSSKMEMLADDSTVIVIDDSVDSIVVHIQNALQQLQNWARLNCMSIHPIKTEIMFVSKSPFIGPIPPIILDNHLIE